MKIDWRPRPTRTRSAGRLWDATTSARCASAARIGCRTCPGGERRIVHSSSVVPALEGTLGYTFEDQSLLRAALIHTSYVNERPGQGLEANERLEFLGDAVLGVVVAHRLYELRPESPEGELTVLRAWLVRQSTLARWARPLALRPHLLLGRGEARGGGRDRPALLSRGFEALIGSIYLDGGVNAAIQALLPFVEPYTQIS